MGKTFKYRQWRLLPATNTTPDDAREVFDVIMSGEYQTVRTLKDHHRSQVITIDYKGKEWVVKTPLEKNKRPWIRFTTLFRQGEAFRNLIGMELLALRNIPSTRPVMAAECRRFGMVTDAWVIYEFLDGIPCAGKLMLYPEVVKSLADIHARGLLHGDSQIQNFLYHKDTIYIIDANPKKIGIIGFKPAYEYAYLLKSAPGIDQFFGPILHSARYQFMKEYLHFNRRLARFRRRIKRAIGLKVKEG